MGAGRKTETYTLSEALPYWSGSGNVNTYGRNLCKGELGGVIFGCKYSTIKECYTKQLFGLPAPHISYVKNIDPGLTLFLFNYSDRKLHGIFEAASHGKLSIDSRAWTSDGTDTTPYAAQVRVRVRLLCEPLLEEQFSRIIAENYFAEMLFWFELDQSQTNKLIRLFSPSSSKRVSSASLKAPSPSIKAIPASLSAELSVSGVKRVDKWSSLFKSTTDLKENREQIASEAVTDSKEAIEGAAFGSPAATQRSKGWEIAETGGGKQNAQAFVSRLGPSYSSVVRNMIPSSTQSQKTNEVSAQASKKFENSERSVSQFPPLRLGSRGSRYACNVEDNTASFKVNVCNQQSSSLTHGEFSNTANIAGPSIFRHQASSHESKEDSSNCACSDVDNIDWDASSFQVHLDGLNKILEDSTENDVFNSCGEVRHSHNWNMEQSSSCMLPSWDYENHPWDIVELNLKKSTCGSSHVSAITGDVVDDIGEAKEKLFMDVSQKDAVLMLEMGSSSFQALVAELLMEVKDLKLSQIQQADRMNSLEKELFESRKEIFRLKGQSTSSEAEEFLSLNESCPDYEETILVVGGSDGSTWLSTLDCYSLSKDKLKLICPMTSSRTYSAVAMLSGEVYMIGGIHEDFSVGTVESYNREKNAWVGRPSLNQRKGNLAAVSLNDKIFALGGGDGSQPFGNVEMLDLQIAMWITTQPMIEKRFAPAAAEINQVLYVVGGYDGTDYLKSVERYDPREVSWTMLECMSTKRGWHSLVVLHEKLYAIGGHNGDRMVATVEVFDPRAGRWISEEPMNQARGYFGSVVIGDAIYVLGGINDKGNLLDTVECYTEGYGWQLMEQKGFGRRSFFSALLF